MRVTSNKKRHPERSIAKSKDLLIRNTAPYRHSGEGRNPSRGGSGFFVLVPLNRSSIYLLPHSLDSGLRRNDGVVFGVEGMMTGGVLL